MDNSDKVKACPSAQPDMEGSRIFGILDGTSEQPRIAYLDAGAEIAPELALGLKEVLPTEIFRYAARCEEARCSHFDGIHCTLARRLRVVLPAVTTALPVCTVRSTCRWYAEEGGEICLRCPQIVTMNVGSDDAALRAAATPPS